jgi:hypothetical protein
MIEMLRTEYGEFRFKVKEGIDNVWIDAEPQSRDGAMPGGIAGMGFTLYTNDIALAERIADFFNNNIHQVLIVTKVGVDNHDASF